jgi:hypothetical protein
LKVKEKKGTEKVSKMMSTYNNEKAPNAHEKNTGEDIPPHLLGYFPYRTLGIKKNKPGLMKGLGFHNLEYNYKEGVSNLQGIPKETEQSWLKKELASEYIAGGFQEPLGKTCSGRFFRLPLNRSFTENEKVEK